MCCQHECACHVPRRIAVRNLAVRTSAHVTAAGTAGTQKPCNIDVHIAHHCPCCNLHTQRQLNKMLCSKQSSEALKSHPRSSQPLRESHCCCRVGVQTIASCANDCSKMTLSITPHKVCAAGSDTNKQELTVTMGSHTVMVAPLPQFRPSPKTRGARA